MIIAAAGWGRYDKSVMVQEIDPHKTDLVIELVERLIRAGRSDDLAVLHEVAERLEIEVMAGNRSAAERHLLAAAADYLAHCVAERGGEQRRSLLEALSEALAEEN